MGKGGGRRVQVGSSDIHVKHIGILNYIFWWLVAILNDVMTENSFSTSGNYSPGSCCSSCPSIIHLLTMLPSSIWLNIRRQYFTDLVNKNCKI